MSAQKMTYLSGFSVKNEITSEDVADMRRKFWEDNVINEEEAAFLFSLNDRFQSQNEDWIMFFIEAMSTYCVSHTVPRGYMTQDNVDWLVFKIHENNAMESATELMLLIKILETAHQVPQTLVIYTLEQIKEGILKGNGPFKSGDDARPGVIDKDEVEMIRRVLYSVGGDGNISITKREAEFLFDLNEKSEEELNHASWLELYTVAVTNYLMTVGGHEPVPRETVIKRQEWLEERGTTWGFMSKMLNFSTWSDTNEHDFSGMSFERMEQQNSEAESITEQEASWLYSLMTSDSIISDNEKEMLKYLFERSAFIPDNLKTLLRAA